MENGEWEEKGEGKKGNPKGFTTRKAQDTHEKRSEAGRGGVEGGWKQSGRRWSRLEVNWGGLEVVGGRGGSKRGLEKGWGQRGSERG